MIQRFPHLTCCPEGARFIALRFDASLYDCEYTNREAFLAAARATPPRWKVQARDWNRATDALVAVRACPFCTRLTPDVRLRKKPPRRLCSVIDGGYYCATCERRLIECRCAPTERLWEAVGR